MPDLLLLALLLAAVAIGWWLGRRERGQNLPASQQPSLSRDYFVGLNYLLNEQPDRAIETFVAALEVNSDTIETHIALGNLFRSRGEADRAVKIHQNLLARPSLSAAQSSLVQLELSRDFLHLGLLDRAERLLQSVVRDTHDDDIRQSAKRLLVDLLEQEQEWQAALEVAQPTLINRYQDIRRAAAHWLCELAEQDRQSASPALARKRLRQALSIDEHCVRANWLLAKMEHDTGQYKAEIRILKRIPQQDSDFAPIILEPLRNAYRMLDDEDGLEKSLRELIHPTPFTSAVIMLAETLRHREGNDAAMAFISEQLATEPSLRGVDYLMDLYRQSADSEERTRIDLLKRHTHTLLEARPRYRCRRCGFAGSQLHWRCPSCRSWGTTKPITGIEGE
ncbi:lipopolysaccharide assembly protein B [Litchfieldella qijiaojingensis]|uniref:Lipopolysaccharide assembly protein B n=1 Tax=Litchfieldella qijiaojingensis TaxID=980347 RepID=A0ABQ2Z764_9GAMM|nr:lipopolysaccharide assembly protein LapB [Halomonas qijiaojingensis]GGY07165.1 lipopolysaccharide assembly protein B [Halomonas qijiaojingensis]